MRDPRGKLIVQLCLSTIYLTVTESAYLPKTPARRAFEKKHDFVFPQNSARKGMALLANVKIPNREFCSEMILRPEDHYLVLPWWYNYCQDLKEKSKGGIQGNINYDSIHKYILAEVQLYRKRVNDKTISLTDLEKELIAVNNAKNK